MLCFSYAAPATGILMILGYASSFARRTLFKRPAEADFVKGGGSPQVKVFLDCQHSIDELLNRTNANPIMVRLAAHDSNTYDASLASKKWPKAGGAIGSIVHQPELEHFANRGLDTAVELLRPIKGKFPSVSWADIIQMASARAVELAGGPRLHMRYGRVDCRGPEDCSPEGNLPYAKADGLGMYGSSSGTKPTEDANPGDHLKKVFYRMGMTDEEIVALSGARTLGRAFSGRSGLGKAETAYTDGSSQPRADGTEAAYPQKNSKLRPWRIKRTAYTPGGSSWTPQWLIFDNSYFRIVANEKANPELLKLPTDKVLFEDFFFRPFAEKFRDDQAAFFESYAKAHVKLSELGSKFEPAGGIYLNATAA